MIRPLFVAAALAAVTLTQPVAVKAADVGVDLNIGRHHDRWDGDRDWRSRGPGVGIVVGEARSCGLWRHECADRWGWRTWRFNRCLARHGC